MGKPQSRRILHKIIPVWIDTSNGEIVRVRGYVLDPYTLTYNNDERFDSDGVGVDGTSDKVLGEKFTYFIKQSNIAGTFEARPQLIVWDQFQWSLLEAVNNKITDNIRKNIIFLQDYLYAYLKYELRLQSLSFEEITDYLNITGEPHVRFAKLALWFEHINREISKKYKPKPPKKEKINGE